MSLPHAFMENMKALLGSEYPEFAASYERPPLRSLRVNTLKTSPQGAAQILGLEYRPVPWAAEGLYFSDFEAGRHPLHHAGVYYIQEASAMAPVAALDPRPGERVLDLCAAPGGKSTQIGCRLAGSGLLLSNEIEYRRVKALVANIERMGIINVAVTCEHPQRLAEYFGEYFDKVLVDAPCSGEGMFRKDAGAVRAWNERSNASCALRQRHILYCAARTLRPGGLMVYSTCTFSPVENEMVIDAFLKSHGDFALEEPLGLDMLSRGLMGMDMCRRVWPHRHGGDGHFIACLRKKGSGSGAVLRAHEAIKAPAAELYSQFEQQALNIKIDGVKTVLGDTLFIIPRDMPDLSGLKTLHMGLRAGEMLKNRFKPSQMLALALKTEQFKNVAAFGSDDKAVVAYLSGGTLKGLFTGWGIVAADGFPLGWVKGSDGLLKNHYPKHLRRTGSVGQ